MGSLGRHPWSYEEDCLLIALLFERQHDPDLDKKRFAREAHSLLSVIHRSRNGDRLIREDKVTGHLRDVCRRQGLSGGLENFKAVNLQDYFTNHLVLQRGRELLRETRARLGSKRMTYTTQDHQPSQSIGILSTAQAPDLPATFESSESRLSRKRNDSFQAVAIPAEGTSARVQGDNNGTVAATDLFMLQQAARRSHSRPRSPTISLITGTSPHVQDHTEIQSRDSERAGAMVVSQPDPSVLRQLLRKQQENHSQSWQKNLERFFGRLVEHTGAKHIPGSDYVEAQFNRSLKQMREGVNAFIKGHQFGGIGVSRLTEDSLKASEGMVMTKHAAEQFSRLTEILQSPNMTPEGTLVAFAMGAIHTWVYLGFDELVGKSRDPVLADFDHLFQQENPQLYEKFRQLSHIRQLERTVEPGLGLHASNLATKLVDALLDFRKVALQLGDSHTRDIEASARARIDAKLSIERAFHIALSLRLKFACSPCEYDYSIPEFKAPLDRDVMQPEDKATADGLGCYHTEEWTTVLCALCPIIRSRVRNGDADSWTVVLKARVLTV